jgi:peptide/nickel transport system ATP-binding protein
MVDAVLAHSKVSRQQARELARDTLGMMGIASPEERLQAYPHQFSGGMRQRVAIAIAMLHKPDLIIADEPTTALDVTIQAQILSEVQKLARQHGTALIWITHDLSVVAGLADEVAVMYAGRIVEQGSVDAVLDAPLHPTRRPDRQPAQQQPARCALRQIPGMTPNLLHLPPTCAFAALRAPVSQHCLDAPNQRTAAGHRVLLSPHQHTRAMRNMDKAVIPLIETRAVSRRFGERRQGWLDRQLQARGWSRPPAVTHALDQVDLKVLPGEVVGLVGESGCGKSTLGRVACGLLDPSDGQVLINGRARSTLTSKEEAEARLQVQMIFQNPMPA